MTTRYILSVPYNKSRFDFSRNLANLGEMQVSRMGPQRRVQVSVDSRRIADLRKALPAYVRIELAIPHRTTHSMEAIKRGLRL